MPRTNLTRRQRRQLRSEAGQAVAVHPALTHDLAVQDALHRHPSNQDPGGRAPRSVPSGRPGRPGLVMRAKGYMARRYIDKLGPAIVAPLVAGAVVLVVVGVVVGLVLGLILAAGVRGE